MKQISNRISRVRHKGGFVTYVILGKIPGWKETMLAAWLFCWTLCGAYFIYELTQPHQGNQFMFLLTLTLFWAYYEFRIGRAYIFRRKGKEFIKITPERLTYKRSIISYGKAHHFLLENIQNLGMHELENGSWGKVLENSFWVLGGQKIRFDYMGKEMQMGIQLTPEESEKLVKALSDDLKKFIKISEKELEEWKASADQTQSDLHED